MFGWVNYSFLLVEGVPKLLKPMDIFEHNPKMAVTRGGAQPKMVATLCRRTAEGEYKETKEALEQDGKREKEKGEEQQHLE